MRTLLLAIGISLLALSAAPLDASAQRAPGRVPARPRIGRSPPPVGGSRPPRYGGSHHDGSHHGGDHHHSSWWGPRVSIGVWPGYYGWRSGVWWGSPYYPYAYSSYPYYSYFGSYYAPFYPYWQSPRVIAEEPPVYIQREDAPVARSWYYCKPKRGYYPKAETCPEPWIPVPPRD